MTWGELKKKAEELRVPDEATIVVNNYEIKNNPEFIKYKCDSLRISYFYLETLDY